MRCGISLSKKNKLWVWRAVERGRNRTIGWCVGDRSTETFRAFYQRFEHLDAMFYSDDWESYAKVIPSGRLVTGKKHTIGIEQNNSNIRRFSGRFTRRKKNCFKISNNGFGNTQNLLHINENNGFDEYLKPFSSIFG